LLVSPSAPDTTLSIATRQGLLRVRVVGSGSPAVLWHSLFVDSTTWDQVRGPLAEHRRLILIDGPSHGGSQAARHSFTLQDCADAAEDVLDHLGVSEPVDWIGNAWGGHVGIVFAAGRPERIKRLITVGTPVRALTRAERRHIVPLVALYRLFGPIRLLVKGVEAALVGADASPAERHVVGAALRAADRRGMYIAMKSVMLHRPSLLAMLPTIALPTMFVAIDNDAHGSTRETRDAADLLPNGSFSVLAGQGHVGPLLQQGPALLQLIADFLGEQGCVRVA
jgi:pimeloyl-ACP methyl ester carboxylesterase